MGDSARTKEAPVQSGDILLGKYQVEHVLGHGGMGVVVAAKHLELGELFAIKFLLPDATDHQKAVSRFMREARAAARLHSPHVARVHDVGRLESGTPYMVMEHLTGSDLAKILKSRGALPLEDAVGLVLQACEAIAEAHALGIVHRDLKPSNLFLAERRAGKPCLKVLDFGISKQLDVKPSERTKTGSMMGSLYYMSPEQMSDAKEADTRSDIWALGVVLYELTTGKLPFSRESVPNLMFEILASDPAPPSHVQPGLAEKLDEVVLRCLRKRAEERYASVEELASELRSIVGARSERPWSIQRSAAQESAAPKTLPADVLTGTTTERDAEPALPPRAIETVTLTPALPKVAESPSPPVVLVAPHLVRTETLQSLPKLPLASRRRGITLAATAMLLVAGLGFAIYLGRLHDAKPSAAAPLLESAAPTSAPEAPAILTPTAVGTETLPAQAAPMEQTVVPGASAAPVPASSAPARTAPVSRRGAAVAKPTAAPTTTAKAAPSGPAPASPPAAAPKSSGGLW